MHRPLWQIFLTLLVLAFVVERAAVASVFYLGGADPTLLGGYTFQTAAGLVAAAGIWLARPWAPVAILVLGIGVAATASLEVVGGVRPALAAVSQALIAAVSAGALFVVLRREFGPS